MAKLNVTKKIDYKKECPHCGSNRVGPLVRGESMHCGNCETTYSVMTGRKLKSEQKHGILEPNMSKYVRGLGLTVHGNRTIDINDKVAQQLRGTDVKEMYQIAAKALGEPVRTLRAKYGHLNIGMQRMNLGNRMRGAK
jgi:hypothetical protein